MASRANIFNLLNDDAADIDVDNLAKAAQAAQVAQAQAQAEAQAKAKAAAAAPAATAAAPAKAKNQNGNKDGRRRNAPRAPAAEGEAVSGNRESRPRRVNPEQRARQNKEAERADDGTTKPKRVFERRSGTGRAPNENKKQGAGSRNWGKPGQDELAVIAETPATPVDAAEATENVEAVEPAATPEPKEEGPKLKTLNEYFKEQGERTHKISEKPVRSAGEGVDSSAWANTVEFKREFEEETTKAADKKEKKKAAKATRVKITDILSSGSNSRSDKRHQRPAPTPKNDFTVNDQSFPSLSKN